MNEKRVIVLHSCGLHQIVGCSGPPYPSTYTFTAGGGVTSRPASLISVTPRYVLYREIISPPVGHFNEPCGFPSSPYTTPTFHPSQQ